MMQRFLATICMAFSICALAACQTPAAPAKPAWLQANQTSPACIAQMQSFVTSDGFAARLSPAAFAQDDRLVIVLGQTGSAGSAGSIGMGNDRIMGAPNSFRLTITAGRCLMAHEQSGRSTPLDACTCIAKP